jgi:hypothetical protein
MNVSRALILAFALSGLTSCRHSATAVNPNPIATPVPTVTRHLDDILPKLTKGLPLAEAEAVLGKPDRVTGSGLTIYAYVVDRGRELWVGFTDKILYAVLNDEDGRRTYIDLDDK